MKPQKLAIQLQGILDAINNTTSNGSIAENIIIARQHLQTALTLVEVRKLDDLYGDEPEEKKVLTLHIFKGALSIYTKFLVGDYAAHRHRIETGSFEKLAQFDARFEADIFMRDVAAGKTTMAEQLEKQSSLI